MPKTVWILKVVLQVTTSSNLGLLSPFDSRFGNKSSVGKETILKDTSIYF